MGAEPPFCLWQSMHVPIAALGSWNAAWRLVFMGGAAGIAWQSRQACCSETRGFCGRLGWWQVVQAMPRLPAWPSWSKVTAPSFAGSVTLPLGLCAAGRAEAAGGVAGGFSTCVSGGAEGAAAGGGGACGAVACVVTGAFGAVVTGGRAAAEAAGADVPAGEVVVVVATGDAAGASVAATPGVGDAGGVVTGGCSSFFPQAKATDTTKRIVASRRARDFMAVLLPWELKAHLLAGSFA